jgi:tellurite resistance protein
MVKRNTHSTINTTENVTDRFANCDLDVMQGLVTAGAVVALADGGVAEVEREELLNFIDRQQLVPTIPRTDIAETFDRRVRQLENRDSAEVILENLRPLVGLSLASVVLRTAERVAAADGKIHPAELQALKLIRLIMTSLSAKGPSVRLRTCDRPSWQAGSDTALIKRDPESRFFGARIRGLQQITIRHRALILRYWLGNPISLAALVLVIVGLAISLWLKSYLAITIQRNEGLSFAANPHLLIQSCLQKVMVTTDVNVGEAKYEFMPMLNPYLPFRILDPVY